MRRLIPVLLAFVPIVVYAQAGQTVHYELKMQDLKYTYGPSTPVMKVKPGDIIDTRTVDADGRAVKAAGGNPTGPNPLTGPFYVEGAEPGDTLSVKFLALDVDGKEGWGSTIPGWGILNSSKYSPAIGGAAKDRVWTYPIDSARKVATFHALDSKFTVDIPLHPFLGCVGVAPADGESRSSIVPAEFGGNMDSAESSVGNTLYLPVSAKGALLFMGDGHAAMGDGEIDGTAIEVSMKVRVQVGLIKKQKIEWPRYENSEYIMTVGAYRPLDDAARIAFTELIGWIHTGYGLSESDAYDLLSKTAEVRLAEMVDPNFVIIAKVKKRFLPPAKK